MSLLSELKQRNVFKVAVAYLIVAWLLMQVASLVLPQLGLPDWTPTLVTVLLILGFPVALILAWAYELTPAGVQRAGAAEREEQSAKSSSRPLNHLIVGLALVAVAVLIGGRFLADDSSAGIRRIAVLPFDNLSEAPEDEFFAAGLHEEVLNQLAKLSGLAVISRSSVLQFADNRPSIPEIGELLDADAVVEASVRYAGDQLMVTVQLIDADSDTHILSETYRASRTDVSEIFAVQAEIATEISVGLGTEIAPGERRALERVPTESVEAYAHYLRARELNSAVRLPESMAALDRAIAADPGFAEPYADRAYLYAYGQIMSAARTQLSAALDVDQRAYQDLAVQNADRALELFPALGQAWVARALNHMFHFRWRSAEAAFDRALNLSPNDPIVLREYAQFLSFRGDHTRALELARRAVALDPNGLLTLNYAASVQAGAGAVDEARATIERAYAVDPNNAQVNLYAALLGTDAEVRERSMRVAESNLSPNETFLLAGIALVYQQIGLDDDANRALDRYEMWAQSEDVGAGGWTQYYLFRGDAEQALRWYETAVERIESGLADTGFIGLNYLPGIEQLSANQPEFAALAARLEAIKAN